MTMWKDILKEDEDSREFREDNYARARKKPGLGTFREGMGFDKKPFTNFRGSGSEEMPATDLANWFAATNDNFEGLMEQLSGGIEGEGTLPEGGPGGGMPFKYKEDTGSFKKFKETSMIFAKNMVEAMAEAYIDSIIRLDDFDDDDRSTQGILNSKGYQETVQTGFKTSTEILSIVMDTVYNAINAGDDKIQYLGDELEDVEDSVEYLTSPATDEEVGKFWNATGQRISTQIERIINNELNTMFGEPSLSLDFDGDGEIETINKEKLIADIKRGAMSFLNGQPSKVSGQVERQGGMELLEIVNANVIKHFGIIKLIRLGKLEESQTEEGEVDYEDRPEIEFGEDEDFGEDFRQQNKSFDEINYSWQSILKVGGAGAVGMTSMAGFTPAIHNITHGGDCCDECAEVKPPCSRCMDKTTPCGCGN